MQKSHFSNFETSKECRVLRRVSAVPKHFPAPLQIKEGHTCAIIVIQMLKIQKCRPQQTTPSTKQKKCWSHLVSFSPSQSSSSSGWEAHKNLDKTQRRATRVCIRETNTKQSQFRLLTSQPWNDQTKSIPRFSSSQSDRQSMTILCHLSIWIRPILTRSREIHSKISHSTMTIICQGHTQQSVFLP